MNIMIMTDLEGISGVDRIEIVSEKARPDIGLRWKAHAGCKCSYREHLKAGLSLFMWWTPMEAAIIL